MNGRFALPVVLVVTALVACADPTSTPAQATTTSATRTTSSCDATAATGTCSEYTRHTNLRVEKLICQSIQGRFAKGLCPAAGRIGSCIGMDGEIKRYYRTGSRAFTRESAREDCTSALASGRFEDESEVPPVR
jgi:hypothetical protein